MDSLEKSYSLKMKQGIDICLRYHRFKNNNNEHVLLMLSGGMDSVSLAWNLLEHTNQTVHIHSIHLDNSEGRCKAEGQAIHNSINWLKENQRPFEFSSSFYSWKHKYPGGRDMALALFQAARVMGGVATPFTAVYTGDYNMGKEESAEAYGVLNALSTGKKYKTVWATPIDYMSKTPIERSLGVYLGMPEQLRNMYWSCRTPKETPSGFLTCGVCHACVRQHDIHKAIKEKQ